jgi:hypothetical protein
MDSNCWYRGTKPELSEASHGSRVLGDAGPAFWSNRCGVMHPAHPVGVLAIRGVSSISPACSTRRWGEKDSNPSVPHHDERCCPLARRFPRRMRHATGACLFLGKPSARRNLAGVGLAGKAMLHTVQSRRETREAGSNASSCSALGGRRDAFIENGNLAGIGLGAPMQGSETRSINRLIFGVVSAGIGTHRRNAG